ncbi:MAG: amidase family protein [Acidithiobacillales bacterium]
MRDSSSPPGRDGAPGIQQGISRRTILGAGAAGGAALLTGGWASLLSAAPPGKRPVPAGDAPWVEATIPGLQAMMASGELTSRELTLGYLARIDKLNPLLHAVIQTNPQAVSIAARRDNERRAGHVRGPLHGIPVIVKDNIAVADTQQTTAGSLALVRSFVPGDAPLVGQLRDAGAVILGKANLSEWANFRGFGSINGWSARGGFTRCPYLLSNDPLGSSSGSAVSAAASLCSVAVGTETDGSIMAPSDHNHTFGLKPTVGLVSGEGIIPIAHSQDTAGPMTRTVTDAAILLGALKAGTGDYRGVLHRGALQGARIGFDAKYFTDPFWGNPPTWPIMQEVLAAMTSLGATIVDVTTDPSFLLGSDELNVLLYEFKVQIAEYLAPLGHTEMRTLADLIAFDTANCEKEMKYFGQEIFELAEATSGDLTDPLYVAARAASIQNSRVLGIDAALNSTNPPLDVLIAPTWSWLYSIAAVAGYPSASLPVGFLDDGSPVGFCMVSTAWQEAKILGLMYDLEQELNAQTPPKFLGAVPPEPPDAGLCTGTKPKASAALAPGGRVSRPPLL